ncbi:MAG: glycosyl hydrolase, partial [Candidatus Baltobacteraceae bacterium]
SLQTVLPQPPVFTGTLAQGPLVPATGTTYLGGFIDPDGGGSSPQKTAAFEAQIGRNLAYNMHFYGWNGPFPGANEADDIAHGRIPVIAWNCGTTDAQIVSGAADSIIIAHANALKAFGKPIFVRWFWEMNLDDTNNAPRKQCYDPKTDLPSGYFSPTQYIAAWQHIHNIFVQQGATNVIWLWCVANAHGGPAQYYPGDSYVDWVAMDNYDTFDATMFHTFYILSNELAQFQEKPFMITETGAHAALQPTFLGGAAAELQSQFPQARAIGYLDSHGSFQDWVLTADGLASFITFAKDSYMSAMASSP